MSIPEIISALEKDGRLTKFVPESRKRPKRRLYFTRPALRDYVDDHSAVNTLVGRGFIHAALTRWTLGDRIYGNRKRGTFLDRLYAPPPEIWEIRVTEPVVQARLFGRFAEPNTLILTKFHTRRLLGDKESPQWNEAMTHCARNWESIFGDQPPFSAETIHEYVTENCDDFPLKTACA